MRPFHCVEDPGFTIVSQVLLDIGARYGRLPVGKHIYLIFTGITAIFVEGSVINTIDLCCQGITQSVASSAPTHSDSDDDHDNRDYLARYVDNPPISRKQDGVSRYHKFDDRDTNTSDILEFWKTMAGFFSMFGQTRIPNFNSPSNIS
ncbi:unnamed protein product [Rotaria sp. Silwood2]|nr:unnamed protein product [Rotaria sp. Silwood2]CAF3128192.1 unnamed protein product [Rotaria sp. Silwood2]CAF4291717.1 unnamed protein product [Rotaria sp. Silwood2]